MVNQPTKVNQPTNKVQLYVYDLSKGMAKAMSLMLTGQQFDGIWHSSVVVSGKEYYYSQGIVEDAPGMTRHGEPVKILEMGDTSLSLEQATDIIASLSAKYTAEKYNIISNNCNHFSDEFLRLLGVKGCPDDILTLADRVMKTPFGNMVKPMLEQLFTGKRHPATKKDEEAVHGIEDACEQQGVKKQQADALLDLLKSVRQ